LECRGREVWSTKYREIDTQEVEGIREHLPRIWRYKAMKVHRQEGREIMKWKWVTRKTVEVEDHMRLTSGELRAYEGTY
jgi:hypothetical protein